MQKPLYLKRCRRKVHRQALLCVVCCAPATGYNFGQIVCESCKAFFRRNALNDRNSSKCRTGSERCFIREKTRKTCKYCRLKKCFDQGLRKEWIMSEEERRIRKQKIEDNRRFRAESQSSSLSPESSSTSATIFDYYWAAYQYLLNKDDRTSLIKIEERYNQAVGLNSVVKDHDNRCLRSLQDFIGVLNEPAHISALRMITFFKLTPEFISLHEDDRLALIKHNMIAILYLHFSLCTDLETGIFHEPSTVNDFYYHSSMLVNFSDDIYYKAMNIIDTIQQLCSFNKLIIKLLILTMMFSKGSDIMEPSSIQSDKIYNAQNVYAHLLWNCLTVRFGFDQTPFLFSRLMFCCMKSHTLARETKLTIAERNFQNRELTPLIQSIL